MKFFYTSKRPLQGVIYEASTQKFSKKQTFLTSRYANVRVCMRGLEMLVFQKILRTYLVDDP